MTCSVVLGHGSYLPTKAILNTELPESLNTSDEWIQKRTGIKQRLIADQSELTSDLGFKAAERALKNAGISVEELDMIVVATTTPDQVFPSAAVHIQHKLNAINAFAFDVQAACAGFVYALSVADSFIQSGKAKTVLVVGAETMSRILDWNDRSTCVLFGDGAGALVLQGQANTDRGVLSTALYSDGRFHPDLFVSGGPSQGSTGTIKMNGREIFKQSIDRLGQGIITVLEQQNLTIKDVDWFIPHQANQRILEAVADKFDLPMEKMIITVPEHANTSAASVPLAIDTAGKAGKLRQGDLIAMTALGAGLTWGGVLIRW